MTESSPSAPMLDAEEDLDALLARADAELAESGCKCGPMVCGELDEQTIGRRTESILRRRRSDEDMLGERAMGERSQPASAAMDPPMRFVRKPRGVRLPPLEQEQEREQEREKAQALEQERRSLVVSSLYPSHRSVTPQARIVRWNRKRKSPGEMTWDSVARPAHNAARLERAKALAGTVAYI
jgi:hypothetical protein